MSIGFLTRVFEQYREDDAIVWNDKAYSYAWLINRTRNWRRELTTEGIRPGHVVILEADFSPESVALFLALTENGCVIVPLTDSADVKKEEFIGIAQGNVSFVVHRDDDVTVEQLAYHGSHELYDTLKDVNHPGLVVFSSGSTGESKAAVHDLSRLMEKFKVRRRRFRSIAFLLFDHLGGLNTLLYSLSNGGCIVLVHDRSPDGILAAVDSHRVDLLPTSPTFINLVLLSEAYKRHDTSSLRTVTYGTEPMPESTLTRFHKLFPHVTLQQTYGLTELGVLRSKSRSSDSLWVRIGGEGVQTRVVDGILHIKAPSAMLGYLNAPSPFTGDGWLNTGDAVLVEDEYLRFLGRDSEIINVGGQKVYPAEVESVIQEMPEVVEATVFGEPNPIVGNIVCAKVNPRGAAERKHFAEEIKSRCRARLPDYMVPVKVIIDNEPHHTERFKKDRAALGP